MKRRLDTLAQHVGGELKGDGGILISGLAGIEEATEGEITFCYSERFIPQLRQTKASAVIVPRWLPEIPLPQLIVKDPRLAMARILTLFTERPSIPQGIAKEAWVSPRAMVSPEATIHPFVYVGDGARIEAGVVVYPFSYIGADAIIGEASTIYPNVTIYPRCILGRRVIVHAGAVIGADGFGFARDGEENVKIPQIGIVQIEDDVEIGANCCIDRATFGKTLVKRGVKFDNLVQVGHNVQIGENSIIISQVGISGSTKLGNNVVLAGQVGLVDHIEIGDNVYIGPQSGITKDVPPNQAVLGTPHLPYRQFLKVAAVFTRLPELKKEMDLLRKRLDALEKEIKK